MWFVCTHQHVWCLCRLEMEEDLPVDLKAKVAVAMIHLKYTSILKVLVILPFLFHLFMLLIPVSTPCFPLLLIILFILFLSLLFPLLNVLCCFFCCTFSMVYHPLPFPLHPLFVYFPLSFCYGVTSWGTWHCTGSKLSISELPLPTCDIPLFQPSRMDVNLSLAYWSIGTILFLSL